MRTTIKVFVTGANLSDDVVVFLENIRRAMNVRTELLLMGFSPFVPWFDFIFKFVFQGKGVMSLEEYKQYSTEWLEESDAVYVLPGWEHRKESNMEINKARELGIPVFFDYETLKKEIGNFH